MELAGAVLVADDQATSAVRRVMAVHGAAHPTLKRCSVGSGAEIGGVMQKPAPHSSVPYSEVPTLWPMVAASVLKLLFSIRPFILRSTYGHSRVASPNFAQLAPYARIVRCPQQSSRHPMLLAVGYVVPWSSLGDAPERSEPGSCASLPTTEVVETGRRIRYNLISLCSKRLLCNTAVQCLAPT